MKRILPCVILMLAIVVPVSAQPQKPAWLPEISGLLKTRFEADTETGDMRFNVNSARLGVGDSYDTSNGVFRYQFQAELNAEGKFSILDTYAGYTYGSFDVTLGQQQNRFGTELNRGTKLNYFASTSFLGTYISSYYGAPSADGQVKVGSLGARDLGVMLTYNNKTKVPINLMVGLLNGAGVNNPAWRKSMNFVARAWIKENTVLGGFGAALNYYTGTTPFGEKITMGGAELRYIYDRWIVEGEYASRWLMVGGHNDRLDLAAVHAIYRQPVKWGVIKFVAPALRWDYGNNIAISGTNSSLEKFNAQRATAGVTFGFAEKLLKCELRLNYEQMFIADKPAAVANNPMFHNKFIAEFYFAF